MLALEMEQAFLSVYNSAWYITGAKLLAFEQAFATYNHVKYAIGLSNGLDALTLGLQSVGVGKDDEVILPAHTYIATALAVSRVGAKPIFVESTPNTYLLNPDLIEEAITPHTKAILPVHLYGQACDMSQIMNVAKRHELFVIEDFAQAHGASWAGRLVGTFGKVNASSFYPTKNLGALGDAGVCTTDCPEIAARIRLLQNYGSLEKNQHQLRGYNMRMDELQAAFLSVKLPLLEQWNLERQAIAAIYRECLEGVGDLILPYTHPEATHVFHLFVIQTSHRDSLRNYLLANGVESMVHYPTPVHLQVAYQELGFIKGSFPIAENLSETLLSLPIWPGMKLDEIEYVVQQIRSFYKFTAKKN
ncbi:DegT/DnrJ/EryC1/StrS family aminotransferase [Mongoliitalea daihaiensis]|uniref:DegT/DnrJ/EryC1/StrS family aminotransferase n=1 Tax=Mongoliitalea daihaiensis TaxID=2782006 RepID=UPI001F3F9AA7|nr:DegT/DnrJ/EryC1/StrS family aminotransferase [Mongoliitalea daihaiensis]